MWEKLIDVETVYYMKKVTGDTEDDSTIDKFIKYLKENVDYKEVVIMATQWHTYSELRKAGLAVHYVNHFHLSRFIILLEYLSKKFVEGRLK